MLKVENGISKNRMNILGDARYIKQDGSTPLTADWNMGAFDLTGGVDATFSGQGSFGSLVANNGTISAEGYLRYSATSDIGTSAAPFRNVYASTYWFSSGNSNISLNGTDVQIAAAASLILSAGIGTNVITIGSTSDGYITSNLGVFNFGDDNLITTGLGTLGSLLVDTTTLAVNIAGYTDKVGIGTATPTDTCEISYGDIPNAAFSGRGVYLTNPLDADGTITSRLPPALIFKAQGKGATNQTTYFAQVMTPGASGDNVTLQFKYKFGAGAWATHPFYVDLSNGFLITGAAAIGEDIWKAPWTITLGNTTAATSGVDQFSPSISWYSQGWKSAATAASQYMGLNQMMAPEQGVLSPIGVHKWCFGINAIGNSIAGGNEVLRLQWGSDAGVTGVVLNEQSLNDYVFRVEGATDANLFTIDAATESVKICGATTSLLGFYGVTAVDQPATVSDAATQDITGTDTVDKTKVTADLTSCKNAINAIIDRLQEVGLIA